MQVKSGDIVWGWEEEREDEKYEGKWRGGREKEEQGEDKVVGRAEADKGKMERREERKATGGVTLDAK